jgi:hypothetical protein
MRARTSQISLVAAVCAAVLGASLLPVVYPHVALAAQTAAEKPSVDPLVIMCQPREILKAADYGVNYFTDNGVWTATDPQCINSRANMLPGFTVTDSASHNGPGGRVQGYPFILTGCFFALCTNGTEFPAQVSQLSSLRVSWDTSNDAAGEWNTSIDTYLSPNPAFLTSSGLNSAKAEVMVWLRAQNMPHCTVKRGQVCRTIHIGGIRWYVNYWRQDPPESVQRMYFQFRSVVPRSSLNRFDLLSIYRWLAREKFIKASWYLQGVEAGNEITRGGIGLSTKWFRVWAVSTKATS